jgi:hypothetical protein
MDDPTVQLFLSRLRLIGDGIESGDLQMANDEKWYLGRAYLVKQYAFRRDYPNMAAMIEEIVGTPEITAENGPRLLTVVNDVHKKLARVAEGFRRH